MDLFPLLLSLTSAKLLLKVLFAEEETEGEDEDEASDGKEEGRGEAYDRKDMAIRVDAISQCMANTSHSE